MPLSPQAESEAGGCSAGCQEQPGITPSGKRGLRCREVNDLSKVTGKREVEPAFKARSASQSREGSLHRSLGFSPALRGSDGKTLSSVSAWSSQTSGLGSQDAATLRFGKTCPNAQLTGES